MARRRRLISNQGAYHVYNRSELGQPIFETNVAKQVFLETILVTARRFAWQLHAFAIMTNHFHLVLTTPRGNLSEGMHALQSAFANKHKAFRGSIGHVFQSTLVARTTQPALWRLVRLTTSTSTPSGPASSRSRNLVTVAGPATVYSAALINAASSPSG
jgi:REP element-mobilizing transposase RayT